MSPIKVQDAKREEGFTLIELLVVVIIIGILAAIAIPTFLNQRERGWQAELTSAVRNAALDVEAAATANNGVYPDVGTATGEIAEADLDAFFARDGDNMTYTYVSTGTAFTFCATHPQVNVGTVPENRVRYNSATGGLLPFEETAC